MSEAFLLVEGIEEIAQAEGMRARVFPQGVTYISLSSQAKYELTKRQLPHVNSYDYYNLEELYRITDAQYDDLRCQCDALDEFLQVHIPDLAQYGIRPFYLNYYNAKIILDTIKQRMVMVQALYDAFGDKLYAFAPSVKGWSRFLRTEDRLTGYILEFIGRKARILPRDIAPCAVSCVQTQIDSRIADVLSHIRNRPKNLSARIIKKIIRELSKLGGKGIIWTCSPFIPAESLIATGLKRHYPNVVGGDRVTVPDLKNAVFDHPAFVRIVDYVGLPVRPILEDWFSTYVLAEIPDYIGQARNIDELIIRDQPVMLESRTYFDLNAQLMAVQFRRHGKKVVGTNHGCLGIQNEKMFGICDLHYASDYFVWGQGVEDYVTRHYPLSLPHGLNVSVGGTEHFEKDAALTRSMLCGLLQVSENKTIVLMPGSAFRNNIFYNWYSMMDEQQEYVNQTQLIDFFATREDCVFLYKGWHNPDYDESHICAYMADKGASNLIYLNETSLRHILPAIDVFVTDRPSTSLLEAMSHNKICYSYNRWITFPGNGAALYNEAAQHFVTPEAMLEKFARDIENKFSGVPQSLSYYNAYGNATTGPQRRAIFTNFLRNALLHK